MHKIILCQTVQFLIWKIINYRNINNIKKSEIAYISSTWGLVKLWYTDCVPWITNLNVYHDQVSNINEGRVFGLGMGAMETVEILHLRKTAATWFLSVAGFVDKQFPCCQNFLFLKNFLFRSNFKFTESCKNKK